MTETTKETQGLGGRQPERNLISKNDSDSGNRRLAVDPNSNRPTVVLCHPTDAGTGRRMPFDEPKGTTVLTTEHGQGCRT